MGNSQSPSHKDPLFASASRAFTHTELEDLKSSIDSLAAQSQSDGQFVSPSVFKTYFRLQGPLGDRMFDLVTQQRKDQKLIFEDIVVAKGTYEKGTKDDIENFIYKLLDVNGDDIVSRSDLECVLLAMLQYVFKIEDSEPGSSAHRDSVNAFLNAAKFTKHDEHDEKSLSFEDFRIWCTLLPSVRKFLGSLMILPDQVVGRLSSRVPRLLHLENINSNMMLLNEVYAWHIGGILPHQEMVEWELLYHSAVNGLSFNTFMGNISKDNGPTVFIIKDTEGYVYGGYASQPWERHGDFFGDLKSFLFQLYPKASIFRPTGANTNIQWCAVNFGSESIPNGIGFGGKVNHFGLFLSANLDQGHSFSCSTFGSPCLSKSSRICPEVIECWGVVQKALDEEKSDGGKVTVLERFKEDRHMLNLVGLANSSE